MGAVFAIPAMAADVPAAPVSPISYNLGFTSDYIFRGITQTTHAPAVQGGADYTHTSGLYVGSWASNIKWIKDSGAIASGDANVELDTYFGIKNTIANDLGYDVGYVRYNYLGNYTPNMGFNNADTAEGYAAATYKFATLKYSYSLLDGFLTTPRTKGTNYIDLSANYPISDSGVTIGAHIGQQTFVGTTTLGGYGLSYADYKLSAAKDFNGYVIGLTYSNTNASSAWAPNGDQWGKAATTFSVIHSF